ncbi:S-layer homology domain-containing protein [Petroclostridium xylanilyticum]|uniref:S-layer homology domain-containing protein n=1 Tax=Petroclostridium xylanilyticum TaxID=1792311 RepID=UPI000B9986C1|nr:S-layer homology domain-containing protein [Petroclostridium xylanilyticum]
MRNLKKALALVVVFTMMLTLFAGISTASAASDYSSSVARMQKFGIMKGDGTGDLKPFADVTRAEFMTMLTRALGYEGAAEAAKGATKFADVPADHWASGYVNVAVQLGVTKGKSEDTFAPDDKVTVVEALAFIERAMGYEVLAKEKGGWPTGYLVVAKDRNYGLKLLDGVSEAATLPAPRGLIAKLFDNALNGPFYEIDSYSNGVPTYKQDAGVTFLTKMGYVQKKINGSDTFIVAATPYYGTDADKVKLLAEDKGGSLVEVKVKGYTAEELDQFMGKRVKAYYDDDDDDKLIDIQLADKDKTVVVVAKEISKDGDKIKIKDTSDVETNYEMQDDKIGAVANWNFSVTDETAFEAAGVFGDKKDLIEATAVIFDGKVDFVYGFKYEAPVKVSSTVDNTVTGAKYIRTDGGSKYINKDKDNKAKFTEIVKDGEIVELADLAENDILYVATEKADASESNAKDNRIKFLVVSDTVIGEFKAAKLNGSNKAEKVKIDSTTYEVYPGKEKVYNAVDSDFDDWDNVKFGDTIKARLTKDGKVYEIVKESGATAEGYSIVLNKATETDRYSNKSKYVKVLKADGTEVEYKVNKDSDADVNFASIAKGSLVKIELNADSEIVKVTSATGVPAVDQKANDISKRKLAGGLVAKEDAILFNMTNAYVDTSDDAEADVIGWNNLSDNNTVTYYFTDDGYIVAAMFIDASADVSYAVITDKTTIKDNKHRVALITKDGAVEYDVDGTIAQTAGAVISFTLTADSKVNTSVNTVSYAVYGEIQDVTSNIIKVNDTIYTFADDVVVYYNKDFDVTEDFEALTKDDLYKYMDVRLFLNADGDVAVVGIQKK